MTSTVSSVLGAIQDVSVRHAAIMQNKDRIEDAEARQREDWRPIISYTANLSRLGYALIGSQEAWENVEKLAPRLQMNLRNRRGREEFMGAGLAWRRSWCRNIPGTGRLWFCSPWGSVLLDFEQTRDVAGSIAVMVWSEIEFTADQR